MKKFVLFTVAVALSNIVSAQFFYFNGTSYTQTFDKISTGTPSTPNMPVEWTIYTDATPSTLGTPRTLLSSSKGTQYHWKNTTGGFKDVASADGFTATTDSATQLGATDRALAVRQVSTSNANFGGSDPGAAFVLRVANTKNLSTIKFEFELQSLDDTSHRQTEWVFEYATGNNPTVFNAITTSPASLVTGGDVFSNTKVTGTMPAAVDNSTVPVYFRLRSGSAAMPVPPNNGGNRATTAIDDFKLTWTGTAVGINEVNTNNIDFSVLGTSLSNKVVLACIMEQNDEYTVSIFDMTGKQVYTQNSYYTIGSHVVSIDNINLNTGMYVVKINSANTSSVAKFIIQ